MSHSRLSIASKAQVLTNFSLKLEEFCINVLKLTNVFFRVARTRNINQNPLEIGTASRIGNCDVDGCTGDDYF